MYDLMCGLRLVLFEKKKFVVIFWLLIIDIERIFIHRKKNCRDFTHVNALRHTHKNQYQ